MWYKIKTKGAKKMKKILAIVLALSMICCFFAGCGNTAAPAATEAPAAEAPAATEAPAAE